MAYSNQLIGLLRVEHSSQVPHIAKNAIKAANKGPPRYIKATAKTPIITPLIILVFIFLFCISKASVALVVLFNTVIQIFTVKIWPVSVNKDEF